jgi:hypothetical protein
LKVSETSLPVFSSSNRRFSATAAGISWRAGTPRRSAGRGSTRRCCGIAASPSNVEPEFGFVRDQLRDYDYKKQPRLFEVRLDGARNDTHEEHFRGPGLGEVEIAVAAQHSDQSDRTSDALLTTNTRSTSGAGCWAVLVAKARCGRMREPLSHRAVSSGAL